MKKNKEWLSWINMSMGEVSHHIGVKTTEKVHSSKKDYKRNVKHKTKSYEED